METKFFKVCELVPRSIYLYHGDKLSWNFVSKRAFEGLYAFRRYIGHPMIINNYHAGGDRFWSGFRTPDSPYYSITSQHSRAEAYDIISPTITPEELQDFVKKNYKRFGIGGLEVGVNWLHIDTRYNLDGSLTIFKKRVKNK